MAIRIADQVLDSRPRDPSTFIFLSNIYAAAGLWDNVAKELELDMRRRGYVPDTSGVLLDMGQEEKERLLFWHSERLAAAYELIKTVPGSIIRIVKNLQVCADCHRVLKFVSDIVKRDIYVRGWDMFLQ
ncbi:hypothetical protein CDL15_Pgr004953 [Punica granatum]|uniref:DYW domain-containing protein n=1 Tax=Punica granatum TaxID=22663 RepID=A0A218WWY2_PUNGR|nr:hypothetical protein CDL15_Pgr004953 [Punica granatum]